MVRVAGGGAGAASHADVVSTNGKPLISAIVPTRNRADSLPDALRSIYAQHGAGVHFDVEIVVVDDASTDGTPTLLSAHPAVRYIRLPVNRGVSAARNAGIQASRGRYLAFLDDDDVWLPHKLLQQVRALDAHPEAGAVYSPHLIRGPGPREVQNIDDSAPSGAIFLSLLVEGNHCGPPIALLVRREALDATGGFDEDVPTGEDYDMWLRLASRFPFAFVPGAVAVRQQALGGKFSQYLLAGEAGCCTAYLVRRAIVERAAALLPDARLVERLKQGALATLEARIARALCEYKQYDSVRAHLMSAFRRTPWIPHYALARFSIAQTWAQYAMTVDAPIPATRAFCEELRRAARGQGLKRWMHSRLLLGAVWRELGIRLESAGRYKPAASAAAFALAANPLLMGRKRLSRLVTRAGMGALRQTWSKALAN